MNDRIDLYQGEKVAALFFLLLICVGGLPVIRDITATIKQNRSDSVSDFLVLGENQVIMEAEKPDFLPYTENAPENSFSPILDIVPRPNTTEAFLKQNMKENASGSAEIPSGGEWKKKQELRIRRLLRTDAFEKYKKDSANAKKNGWDI